MSASGPPRTGAGGGAPLPPGGGSPHEVVHEMKSRMETTEIVVGLDIGTTKVCAVVGEVDADGITILGVGNVPCRGLRKGVRGGFP